MTEIECLSKLYDTDLDYFTDCDKIPVSQTNRLILLSHFMAIGKMWDFLKKYQRKLQKQFNEKWNVTSEEWEDCNYTITFKRIEKSYFIVTDSIGMIYDTDLPDDEDDYSGYPKLACDICHDVFLMWNDIESRIKSFCNALGYEFEWDDHDIILEGNGIRTRAYAWADDLDPYFENLEASE